MLRDYRIKSMFFGSAAVKILGALSQLLFVMLLSREVSVSEVGLFHSFLAYLIGGAVIARFGSDYVVLKNVSIDSEGSNVVLKALLVSLFSTIFIVIFLRVISEYLGFDLSYYYSYCLALFPFSGNFIFSAYFKGIGSPVVANIIESTAVPFIYLMAIIAIQILELDVGIEWFLIVYVSVVWFVFLCGCLVFKTASDEWKIDECGRLIKDGWYFFLASVSMFFLVWMGPVLLPLLVEMEDVGLFSIALRISVLISFLKVILDSVLVKQISQLGASGKWEDLERLLVRCSFYLSLLVLPFVVFMFVFPSEILLLFGNEYSSSGWILRMLIASQFLNLYLGSSHYVLSMNGQEATVFKIVVLSVFVTFILMLVGYFLAGFSGAVLGVSAGLPLLNFIGALCVKKKYGINVFYVPGCSVNFLKRKSV